MVIQVQQALALPGRVVLGGTRRLRYAVAVAVGVMGQAVRPGTWTRTVREALAREIVYAGVGAVGFTGAVAFLTGIMVVVQAQLWLGRVGQSRLVAPLLVAVLVREVGPVLATLIVIGRSGSGMAVGLAHMKVTREVHTLESLGLDPLTYLVLPRAIGASVSAFCLSVVLIVVALLGGYACAAAEGLRIGGLEQFVTELARSVGVADLWNVLVKTLVPGLLAGVICATEGLAVESEGEVAQAGTRGVQRSVAVLFVVAAGMSILTYLR